MILDQRGELCSATSLNTGAAGTYLIGSQIDLGSIGRDIGNGEELYLVILVTTGITVASSTGTVSFSLASDSTASVSTSTSTVHLTTASFATSTSAIAAGTVLYAGPVPLEPSGGYEQFLGLLQTTGSVAINAGAIDAFLTKDVAKWKAYADNASIE